MITLLASPALSVQLPTVAPAVFCGLLLVGGCFLCAAVVRAWQGRGGGKKDEGEK